MDDLLHLPVLASAGGDLLGRFHEFAMQHSSRLIVCTAQVTTTLVIFGPRIEVAVRKALKPYVFPVRVTGFIVLHTFIFGVISSFLAGLLYHLYGLVPAPFAPWLMLAVFIAIGVVAERHKKI